MIYNIDLYHTRTSLIAFCCSFCHFNDRYKLEINVLHLWITTSERSGVNYQILFSSNSSYQMVIKRVDISHAAMVIMGSWEDIWLSKLPSLCVMIQTIRCHDYLVVNTSKFDISLTFQIYLKIIFRMMVVGNTQSWINFFYLLVPSITKRPW